MSFLPEIVILFYSKKSDFQWKKFTDLLYLKLFLQTIENPEQSTLFKCLSKLSRILLVGLPNAYEIKVFLYSITFVVLSKFCLSLLQMHFSASMLHLFSELWWKKTITRKSLNWIITLLWNYYKKAEKKLIIALNENENEMIYRNNSSKVFWDILYI